jgi:aminoglycoside phosphotransferase (APT) family kinase protein
MTAATAVRQVADEHGLVLKLGRRCPGGEVGAYYATGEDGRRYVVKWSDNRPDLASFRRIVDRVERLRAIGYPAPAHQPPFLVDGGVVLVQDEVSGRWRDDVPDELVGTVVALNDLQKGQADSHGGWTDYIRMTLVEGADGYRIHDTLRAATRETRRLLAWIESVGRHLDSLPEGDLVHIDFHHRNMLRQGAELVAVVDWEGCRSGDRAFDLVTFCFGMTHALAPPGVEERVWGLASRSTSADALVAYVAHMSLRRVDWALRHHPEEAGPLMEHALGYVARVA